MATTMTKKELLAKIKETQYPEWFDSVSIDWKFPDFPMLTCNQVGFIAIYTYASQQKKGWESLGELPSNLDPSFSYFKRFHEHLIQFLNISKEIDKQELSKQWINHFANYTDNNTRRKIITYDRPETEFLIKLHKEQPKYNQEVFDFLISFERNGNINPPNTPKNFIAYIIAYEFIQRDYTEITKRYDSEKSSLSKLRNDFSNYLTESEAHLKGVLDKATKDGEKYAQKIEDVKTEKEKSFDDWYAKSKQEITDLKDTYENLLKLKEPAAYWKQRADTLKAEGDKHNKWLKGVSIGGIVLAVGVLFCLSNGIMEGIFKETGTAIKWSITFITFVSLLAFGIKHLSKLTLSAFHLARDAEEKEQLTYLFLALHKDSAVSDREREIVLQSLFSRADSGLLKDESSPTMPGNMLGLLEKIGKGK